MENETIFKNISKPLNILIEPLHIVFYYFIELLPKQINATRKVIGIFQKLFESQHLKKSIFASGSLVEIQL